jgi:hypothetical protein
MSNVAAVKHTTNNQQLDQEDEYITKLLLTGDVSKLSEKEKRLYIIKRCEIAGLDHRTCPFGFIKTKDGREVPYANKSATDQLTAKHKLKVHILSTNIDRTDQTVTVHARVISPDGVEVDDYGSTTLLAYKSEQDERTKKWTKKCIGTLEGEDHCNAILKAVTKAKRRAILSACGLGMSDESEISKEWAISTVNWENTNTEQLTIIPVSKGELQSSVAQLATHKTIEVKPKIEENKQEESSPNMNTTAAEEYAGWVERRLREKPHEHERIIKHIQNSDVLNDEQKSYLLQKVFEVARENISASMEGVF